MKITWVTRSFKDYRIPVYAALDKLRIDSHLLVGNIPLSVQEEYMHSLISPRFSAIWLIAMLNNRNLRKEHPYTRVEARYREARLPPKPERVYSPLLSSMGSRAMYECVENTH